MDALRARDVMDRRYAQPLNVDELARVALMSSAHFTREFKRFSNRTPGQFVAEMRATRELLRTYGVAFVQDRRTVI